MPNEEEKEKECREKNDGRLYGKLGKKTLIVKTKTKYCKKIKNHTLSNLTLIYFEGGSKCIIHTAYLSSYVIERSGEVEVFLTGTTSTIPDAAKCAILMGTRSVHIEGFQDCVSAFTEA